jgi:hypothetical protein
MIFAPGRSGHALHHVSYHIAKDLHRGAVADSQHHHGLAPVPGGHEFPPYPVHIRFPAMVSHTDIRGEGAAWGNTPAPVL